MLVEVGENLPIFVLIQGWPTAARRIPQKFSDLEWQRFDDYISQLLIKKFRGV